MTRRTSVNPYSLIIDSKRSPVNKVSRALSRKFSWSANKCLDTADTTPIYDNIKQLQNVQSNQLSSRTIICEYHEKMGKSSTSLSSAFTYETITVNENEVTLIFGSAFDTKSFRWGVANESCQRPLSLSTNRKYVGGAVVDAYHAMKEVTMQECCRSQIEEEVTPIPLCRSEADVLRAIKENLNRKKLI